eukprot:scaffold2934_cov176-Amphora_coffeaeformis.AAC.11
MKLATTIIGCLCLAGGARGKRGGEFNVQYLSLAEDGSVGQVACENTGEVICSTAILAGDFEGTAKVRFTQFDLNPFTGNAIVANHLTCTTGWYQARYSTSKCFIYAHRWRAVGAPRRRERAETRSMRMSVKCSTDLAPWQGVLMTEH